MVFRLRASASMAACFVCALAFAPSAAFAQNLDQEVTRLLATNCVALGVPDGNNGTPGALGPQLNAICLDNNAAPVSNATGGGGASSQGSDTLLGRRRTDERSEALRDGEDGAGGEVLRVVDLFAVEGLGLWATADYTRRERDVTFFETGYEANIWSTNGGVDYRFSDKGFVGAAYSFQDIDAGFDGGGGFDTRSHGATLYGSLTPVPQIFVDASVGYAAKSYEVDRPVSFTERQGSNPSIITLQQTGIAVTDTEGDEISARVITGYEHVMGAVTVGPRVGVDYAYTHIDGYRERSAATGIELVFADRRRDSLQSSLGAALSAASSLGFGVLTTHVDVEWRHEFEDDQKNHRVRFVEDLRANPLVFRFQNEKPDRDFFRLNAGLALVLANGIQTFAEYRTIFGHSDFTSQGIALGVRVELGASTP